MFSLSPTPFLCVNRHNLYGIDVLMTSVEIHVLERVSSGRVQTKETVLLCSSISLKCRM